MATREQLEKALRNADKAGDASAARRLAAELKNYVGPTAKDEYDAAPGWQQPIQAVADAIRLGGAGLTFGGTDKLSEMLGMEGAQARTQGARERAGSAALPLELLPQIAVSKKIPTAALSPTVAGPLGRTAFSSMMSGLEGAGFGGVDALMHDEDVLEGQGEGALWGLGGQAAGDLLSRGVNKIGNFFQPDPMKLGPRDLHLAKDRAYQDVEDAGVEFTPTAIDRLSGRLDDALSDSWPGRHRRAREASERTQNQLSGNPRQARTLTQVDQARQGIERNISRMDDEAEAMYGHRMTDEIDDFLRGTGVQDVTTRSGVDPLVGVDAIENARKLNTRMRKLEGFRETTSKAERQAKKNLNAGEDSTYRNNIESILANPKRRADYTPDEIAEMEGIVTGGQELRQASRLAPGGGFSWQGMAVGGGVGSALGPYGAVVGAALPPIVGVLAKKMADRSTRKAVDRLDTLVSSGGNKATITKQKTIGDKGKKDLARILMLLGINQDE